MELSVNAVLEFKKLYLKEYGKKLTNEEAIDYGMRLIRLVRAVCGDNLPATGFDNDDKKLNNNIELK